MTARRNQDPRARTSEAGRYAPVAHIFGLWAFAVAQPILDLVGRAPDFLVAHRLQGAPLAVLALGLTIGVPLVLAAPFAAPAFPGSRIGRLYADGLRSLLAAAFFAQLLDLRLLERWPSAPVLAAALAGGIGITLALHRWRGLSNLVAATALATLAVPLIFLLRPGVRGLLPPDQESSSPAAIARAPAFESDLPIVLVIFDELPTSSLQRPDGSIDARRFPSFASLAASSDWYRRAVTAGLQTSKAVPAMLTGLSPRPDFTASYRDHPVNLFSWLAANGNYRVVAQETVTRLCPVEVCAGQDMENRWRNLLAAIDDLTVVYSHLLLPPALRDRLPDVSGRWTGFRDRPARRDAPASRLAVPGPLHQEVPALFEDFLGRIESEERPEPAFYYLHLNLPHRPWKYLPSGREYTPAGTEILPPGIGGGQLPQEREALHAWQRHLLQVGYTDRALGQLMERLKTAGIYDRALVVVTADHGHAFRQGQPIRRATDANAEDVLEIPLFVKHPYQRNGVVYDHTAQTIDIVPTIAAALGVRTPWRTDGKELSDPSPRTIAVCCYTEGEATRTFRMDPARRQQTLDRLEELFAAVDSSCVEPASEATAQAAPVGVSEHAARRHDPFDGVFAAGPRPHLLDCPTAELSAGQWATEQGTRKAILDSPAAFANVDPESGFVPSLVSGRIEPAMDDGTELAIAVDGFVRSTTWTYTRRGATRFSALVQERWLHAGSRKIDVYAIEGSQRAAVERNQPILRPLSAADRPARLVVAGGRVAGIELGGGGFLESVDHLFRSDIELVSGGIRGHLAYDRNGQASPVDEFFVFDGTELLYRGEDDPYRRRIARHEDGREQMTFGVFLPRSLRERAASFRLLVRKGELVQELDLSANRPPATFELSRNERGRVDALLRHTGGDPGTGPERIPVPSSPSGLTGNLARRTGDATGLTGWAVDLANPGGSQEVVAFLQGRQFWTTGETDIERPDVALRHGPVHLYSGFRLPSGLSSNLHPSDLGAVRREGFVVYAVSRRGIAARVPFSYLPLEEDRRRFEILPVSDGRRMTVQPPGDGYDGAVDLIRPQANRTVIQGWAADLDRGQRPRQIVIYRDDQFLANMGINRDRPDVVERHDNPRLLRTGFRGTVAGAPDPETFGERHRVFAIMLRGAAVELPLRTGG